jgi:hypothetical protein
VKKETSEDIPTIVEIAIEVEIEQLTMSEEVTEEVCLKWLNRETVLDIRRCEFEEVGCTGTFFFCGGITGN